LSNFIEKQARDGCALVPYPALFTPAIRDSGRRRRHRRHGIAL